MIPFQSANKGILLLLTMEGPTLSVLESSAKILTKLALRLSPVAVVPLKSRVLFLAPDLMEPVLALESMVLVLPKT